MRTEIKLLLNIYEYVKHAISVSVPSIVKSWVHIKNMYMLHLVWDWLFSNEGFVLNYLFKLT